MILADEYVAFSLPIDFLNLVSESISSISLSGINMYGSVQFQGMVGGKVNRSFLLDLLYLI